VQRVEDRPEVEAGTCEILRPHHIESNIAAAVRMGAGTFDRRRVEVDADELGARNATAMIRVEAPWPQPTSTTRAPASGLATTPSSAGSHSSTRYAPRYSGQRGQLAAPGGPARSLQPIRAALGCHDRYRGATGRALPPQDGASCRPMDASRRS
jgi:hypothetical protein